MQNLTQKTLKTTVLIGVLTMMSAPLTPAFAGTNAFDSVAEFSNTQGAGGWSYGYYSMPGNATSFTVMTYYGAVGPSVWSESFNTPPWTLLWADGGHPNGPNSGSVHDVVRRWTSGATGTLNIMGSHSMGDSGSTEVSVVVNGSAIWSSLPNGASQSFSASSDVVAGTLVDFVINSNGVDYNDRTNFAVKGAVTAVPEVGTNVLLLAGLGALGFIGRRRRLG